MMLMCLKKWAVLVAVLWAVSFPLCAYTPSTAYIELQEREVDLGCISLTVDTLRQHKFAFSNIGTDTLVIIDVVTGCGCVQGVCDNMVIAPGESDTVTVRYNSSRQRLGRFRKSITVFSNDPRSYIRLFVQGEVVE